MKRILLDEGVARSLAKALRDLGLDATAFPNDWKRLPDRDLLARMSEAGYEVLLIGDKNMAFRQVLADRPVAVLVLDQVDRRWVPSPAAAIVEGLGVVVAGRFWRLSSEGGVTLFPPNPSM